MFIFHINQSGNEQYICRLYIGSTEYVKYSDSMIYFVVKKANI